MMLLHRVNARSYASISTVPVQLRRCYSTKRTGQAEDPTEGAFTQRLRDLEEQYPKHDDPLLGKSSSSSPQSVIDTDERLVKLEKELDQRRFEMENQVAIQATKIPNYADRNTRETAHSAPWTGKETTSAASLRMLQDVNRPSRSMREAMKMGKARDKVLDLRLNKLGQEQDAVKDEHAQFREIYTEKFTPIGSFDKIRSLADARIDDAINRGEFKNIPRGDKLDVTVGAYVDRTEHHLNNILVNQNLSPPWIEKQGGVNSEIQRLRKDISQRWITHVDLYYHRDHAQMKRAFETQWKRTFESKMTLVNNSIRSYNLQAPLSTQKFYLLMDKELERCYKENDVDQVKRRIKEEAEQKEIQLQQRELEQKRSRGFKFWNW